MQNAIKKAFTGAIVASTIVWSIGLSAIPFAAKATPASGTLVKASLPAVYYVGADQKRYVFPNEKTYKTWYADFSGVQIITDAELAALPIGGNVTYKPGVRMVKITTDPKVYAVDANGTLRWVTSEAAATAIYGSSWNQMIDDVSDAFFTNYRIGSDVHAASDFVPATASAAATSINVDKGLSGFADGSLTAMLSSGQPVGGTIPGKATGVAMVKVDVKNNSTSAITLDSMTVRRTGVGSYADFSYVYAYEGSNRLTTGRTINSSSNEATFGGLNVTLAAGETKTLWVSADMGTGTAGNQNSIQVVSITAGAVAVSGLPVSGPVFTLAGATVGAITIAANGSFVNAEAGSNAKVAEFQLSASSSEDVMLNKVALYYTGTTARENLSNLTLKQAGVTVATATGISVKDLATFPLNAPFKLEKGSSRVFQVYADISGNARADETVAFYLDNASDLYAIGSTYGYGVEVVRADYDGSSAAKKSSVTIEAGQLNITFNGPSSKDVGIDGKDVEIFNFTMTAQSNIEVRNVRMNLTAANVAGAGDGLVDSSSSPSIANYSDIKLVDTATGAIVGGPKDLSIATHTAGAGIDLAQDVTFDSVFNMSAGQSRTFKLTVDVANNSALAASTADTLTAKLLQFVTGDVRNLDNNTNVADIVPNSASGITGNAATLTSSSLTASRASTPVAQTYIKGAQGVSFGGLILKANDVGDMIVSSVTMTPIDNGTNVGDYDESIQTASLWDGATQIGTVQSPDGTYGTLVFSNLNLTVPSGQSKTLTLKVNLSAVATPSNYQYSVNAAGDLSVTDVNGASKTAAGTYPVQFSVMTIANAGSVTVTKASDDSESETGIVIGGASNVVLAKYKLDAIDEELRLVKAAFDVNASAATAIQSLSLYDGATMVGGPMSVDGAGTAAFTGMNMIIPKDGSKILTVKANLNSVGSSGATTGYDLKVQLLTTGFRVEGTSGSTTIETLSSAVDGNSKVIRKSKPTIALATLSNVLGAGAQSVIRFSVTADAAGDISFKKITAYVVESGTVTVTAPSDIDTILKDITGGNYLNASTATYATSVLTIDLYEEFTVGAGTTKNFDIFMNISGAVSSDSVTSRLLTDDTTFTTGDYAAAAAVGEFVWSDKSKTSHSTSTEDWATGYKVKTLPSDSHTLSK
ncbi:hypothetical protein JW899_00400 [Candidatus Uhrbacteria bacterium]|nr:hypothetical protein [Candidatus Uhrbacteria bacterium]